MNSLKIFLKSNDILASVRLLILAMIVSPMLQIIFLVGLSHSSEYLALGKSLFFISMTTVLTFSVTLFASSVFTDRVNCVYSTQLIGRQVVTFVMKRFLSVLLFTCLMATVMLTILQVVQMLFEHNIFSLLQIEINNNMVMNNRFIPFTVLQQAQLLVFFSFTSTCIGLLFSVLGFLFKDPYKIVNIVIPFIPVLMPVLVPRENLPYLFYLVSWILPGNFVMNASRVGSNIFYAFSLDILISLLFIIVSIYIMEKYLFYMAKTGKNERPF